MLTGASELSFLVTAWRENCVNLRGGCCKKCTLGIFHALALRSIFREHIKMLTEVAINYGREKKL